MEYRICEKCEMEKELSCFYIKGTRKDKSLRYDIICKKCHNQRASKNGKKYYLNNKKEIDAKHTEYYENNKEKRLKRCKEYYRKTIKKQRLRGKKYREKHKEERKIYNKEYRIKNREKINKKYNIRMENDPAYRLRKLVSRSVAKAIKNGVAKKNGSILKFLEYPIHKLKEHLQNLFEPWMTWNNWGKYNAKTWDDHNSNTWKWQLDHIIPQSDLPYISMEDSNFKKCWALKNLRPLSAKQNYLDGINRTRHKN